MDGDSQISNISQYSVSNQKITINGWTENHEEIFYEWADKAMCYRWLHSRSFNIYSWKAAAYTIKNAAAAVKVGPGRTNDNKSGDKKPIKSTEA